MSITLKVIYKSSIYRFVYLFYLQQNLIIDEFYIHLRLAFTIR
nr:MAG TPA: hypothetical protein [Caudoviricetes sp.]